MTRKRIEGPPHVTAHRREKVVVVSAEELKRPKGGPTGEALIAALQASPLRDVAIEPGREPMPVRDLSL